MEEYINKIYARTNNEGFVVHTFSEAFEQPLETDICIDDTNTERHGAQNYEVYNECDFRYKIVDGKLIEL